MSKIGDLIVRLFLEDSQYNKSIKQAEKNTNTFGARLKKAGVTGMAVWGAISAAIVKVGHDMVNASQRLGDAWQMAMTKMQARWQEFVRSLGSWDFDNFFNKLKDAAATAERLQSAQDALFEDENASKILKAQRATELAEYERLFRDTSKSDQERIKAGKAYLAIMEDILEISKTSYGNLFGAEADRFLSNTRAASNPNSHKMLVDFLGAYNQTNPEFMSAIGWLRDNLRKEGWDNGNILDPLMRRTGGDYAFDNAGWSSRHAAAISAVREQLQKIGYVGTDEEVMQFADLGRNYELKRNDKDVQGVVDAYVKWKEALTALYNEYKRFTTQLDALKGKTDTAVAEAVATPVEVENPLQDAIDGIADLTDIDDEIDKIDEQMQDLATSLEMPEIDWSNTDALLAPLDDIIADLKAKQDLVERMNDGFEDALVSSVSDGIQAISDAMFGLEGADAESILASLLQPFGNFAKKMGAMLIAYGISMDAFKQAFANPYVAIAAGAGLIAVGAGITSAISSFNATGASTAATSTAYAGSTGSVTASDSGSEITVYVKGRISGSDIVLSGQKTIDKWSR